MSEAKDRYDEAIGHLMQFKGAAFRGAVRAAWQTPYHEPGGALFELCEDDNNDGLCGCLTQVKDNQYPAQSHYMTRLIRDDDRIPNLPTKITKKSLPVFAEWQRRMDRAWNRKHA
jgi:hypothetical protein